jgi:hypothetical protein
LTWPPWEGSVKSVVRNGKNVFKTVVGRRGIYAKAPPEVISEFLNLR